MGEAGCSLRLPCWKGLLRTRLSNIIVLQTCRTPPFYLAHIKELDGFQEAKKRLANKQTQPHLNSTGQGGHQEKKQEPRREGRKREEGVQRSENRSPLQRSHSMKKDGSTAGAVTPSAARGLSREDLPLFSQSEFVRVPGATAATYTGAGFFNTFLRKLLKVDCGLGYFARSLVSHSYAQSCTSACSADGFPLPLPYPEVARSVEGGGDSSSDVLKQGVNSIVLVLNYLHLERPRRAPVQIRLGARLTRRQWEMVRVIKQFANA